MAEERKSGIDASGVAAMLAAGSGDGRAETFLEEQTRLARLQIRQIEEEDSTRRRILRLEHISAVMKVAFEVAVGALAAAILIALSAAIWSAANDNGLVVESFSVPAGLADKGLSGEVVASKLLDRLSALQQQTQSNRAASSYDNNWGNDIKLQIPDTGVSIGEFNRFLHTWLGHQTRISGAIYETPAGIAVTARAGAALGRTFTGSAGDLDALIEKAAESVYAATQPYRYAVFLSSIGRKPEAVAAFEALIASGSPRDRAWALIGLEDILAGRGEFARARRLLAEALAVKPGFIMAYINLNTIEDNLQHDEQAYRTMAKVVEMDRRGRDPDIGELPWRIGRLTSEATLASYLGDYRRQIEIDGEIEALPEFGGQVENARQDDILAYALLHDARGSREAFERLSGADPTGQRENRRAFAEMLLGRPERLLSLRETLGKSLAGLGKLGPLVDERQVRPLVAYALGLKGGLKQAHALIDATPPDCVQCLRIHGALDGFAGNWPGAAWWFERATRAAPSPPFAWAEWGNALLHEGDLDGAIAKFAIAHSKGPHYADALVWWGEALIRKNRSDLATAKFEEAARYAPNWGRLHLKWGEALSTLGRKDEAARQFAIAATLDLSPAERVELARTTHG